MPDSARLRSVAGTFFLAAASGFSVLMFCDQMMSDRTAFPEIWQASRSLHLLICGGLFVLAAWLLQTSATTTDLRLVPLFRSCRLITRRECPLCDEAYLVLVSYEKWLPVLEIVDVDTDPQLTRLYGESVPVVEIDGRVRFRGAVSPDLLRRLIDAAQIRQASTANMAREDARVFGQRRGPGL